MADCYNGPRSVKESYVPTDMIRQELMGSGTLKADSIQSQIPWSKSPNRTMPNSTIPHQSLQSFTTRQE